MVYVFVFRGIGWFSRYKYSEIIKLVLNGTEDFYYQSSYTRFVLRSITPALQSARTLSLNTHFIYGATDNNDLRYFITTDSNLVVRYDAMEGDADNFKSWLATQYSNGKPVTMVYVLETPTYTEITDADTLEELEKLQNILLYPEYTKIECIDNIYPYVKVSYYTNEDISFITLETDRIEGFVDGLDAIKQAIYHILMTERYAYLIYDNNYGVELEQYIGKDLDYIKATIEQTLKEALTYDLRINDVKVNSIDKVGHDKVLINFTAYTIYGDLVLEVNINV